MASFLTGLGRGIGSAAQGYLKGQNLGEAERFRRQQIDEANALKLLLSKQRVRTEKEELPYEVQSFLDTRSRIYGPQGDYRERLDWEGSGNERVYGLVSQSLARYGPRAARLALAIASQPEGSDTAALQEELGRITGQGQAPTPTFLQPGAGPAQPAQAFGSIGEFIAAQPRQAPPSFADQVKPSMRAGYQYGPTDLEAARAGLVGAQTLGTDARTARTLALTPEEVRNLQARTGDIGFQQDLSKRRLNLDAAQADFNNALNGAKFRVLTGQQDYRLQQETWGDLLSAAVRLYYNGGNPADALRPLLFERGAYGMATPNPAAISRYLGALGVPEADQQAILQGFGAGGGGGMIGSAPGGAPQQQPGAPAAPPPSAGAPGAPGQPVTPEAAKVALDAAVGSLRQAGVSPNITSTTRSREEQKRLYARYKAGKGPVAAPPGRSKHEHGLAVDINVPEAQQQQLEAMMAAHGYVRTVPSERWHFEYKGTGQGQPAAAPAAAAAPAGGGGMVAPGGGGNPQAQAFVDNALTPQGAPPSPFAPDTLEGRIWAQYTRGVPADEILRQFKGTAWEQTAQQVVDYANDRQRQRRFAGVPVPDRFGAQAPEPTNFAGTLGYAAVGVPTVSTSPIEPSAGFGTRAPVQRPVIEVTPAAPAEVAAAPPAGTPPLSTAAPAPAPRPGGPSIMAPPAPLRTRPGPSLMGAPGVQPGPSLMAGPEAGGQPQVIPTPEAVIQGPALNLNAPSAEVNPKSPEQLRARKELQQQWFKHELAPGIRKWLARHKIMNAVTQREVFKVAISELGAQVERLPKKQREQAIFNLLEQTFKPAS